MSSMADLAGALGGAGPPGLGPPGPPGVAPGGPPVDLGAPPPPDGGTSPDQTTPGGQFADSLEALAAADDALHAFIQLDPDDADRAEATKALQIVLRLKATNQQDAQSGGMKSLQRALAGGGAPVA